MNNVNEVWAPINNPLMTRWSKKVNPECPLPEYPRPQMIREQWLNLNGLWDYAIHPKNNKKVENYDGKILVPFPLESALSGVKKKLNPDQKLWYRRNFTFPKEWAEKKILLHFGAVDWEANVYINDSWVGIHQGGYTPFSFDITEFIEFNQDNEIVVKVWDPTDKERGKQSLDPKFIWYTSVSGIWQTVWLEPVSSTYIEKFHLTTNIDKNYLKIDLNIKDFHPKFDIEIEVKDNSKIVNKVITKSLECKIDIPSHVLWSPENPFLYSLRISINEKDQIIDEINSYFGMRKISLGEEKDGVRSIKLNNKEIFQFGTLDQGYWPDGIYTAPTDDALKFDIEITKSLGFNMIRKHVKVEPARWYYHCDKIGILVWQDMPNGGITQIENVSMPGNVENSRNTREKSSEKYYYMELKAMVDSLYNSPSIITWVSFNEYWGQFNTEGVCQLLRELDRSRLIDSASGWFDFGIGDIYDVHNYPNPKMPLIKNVKSRAAVVGEFGGLGLEIEGHMYKFEDKFVYRDYKDQEALMRKYTRLIIQLKKLIMKGLSAAIYTQITDVEQEVNGLLTYDREILKFDKDKIRELNISLFSK
jgi:beta-galactosidase/beta-glucuronidase